MCYFVDFYCRHGRIVTPQSQIWLSPTLTLSKTHTRTNTAYTFVLTSRKRVNTGVEMHLAHGFICWWDSLSISKVGQLPTPAMPLTLGPLVGSNSSLLGRDVTLEDLGFGEKKSTTRGFHFTYYLHRGCIIVPRILLRRGNGSLLEGSVILFVPSPLVWCAGGCAAWCRGARVLQCSGRWRFLLP